MWNPVTLLLVLEACLAVIFFGVMLGLWRKIDVPDAALWVLVWCTRVFASVNGIQHVDPQSADVGVYIGLQACSAFALLIILARSELRVLKERLRKALMLQLTGTPVDASRVRV